MHSSGTTGSRPCYFEQNHGLASLTEMDTGHHRANNFVSRTMTMGYATSHNRTSFRNLPVSSPRSARFYDSRFEDHHLTFWKLVSSAKNHLGTIETSSCIEGTLLFCSQECREEQIEIDEAEEKNRTLSSSMKALRNKEKRKSASPNKAQGYLLSYGAVAAA